MNRIRIENFKAENVEFYDQFLQRHPETLFYHSSKYKEFLQNLLGCEAEYLLAFDGDDIRGALPLMSTQWQGKYVYNSLPFYGSNGGIIADDLSVYNKLAAAYSEIACRQSTISATVVDNPFSDNDFGSLPNNLSDSRIAQFTNIQFEENHQAEILARIDSSARRNITKATREGIVIEIDPSQISPLKAMHQANMQAIGGLAKADRFFDLIPQHFVAGEDFDVYVAKKDGLIIAALLLFYFNYTVEYITPVTDAESRSLQPLSLILMAAMVDASRKGFRWWNWGGTWTNQTGVYRFKKKWGAAERHYAYHIQLNDASILDWTSKRILETFPNFYVVPFSALNKHE